MNRLKLTLILGALAVSVRRSERLRTPYLMRKLGYEPAPLVLAFVLGPMMENNLRKALILSDGSFSIFVERPLSLVCLLLAVLLLASAILPMLRARRERIALESTN